jgi:hypothetical protein
MSYVVDGDRQCVGFVLSRGPHRFEGFDREEVSLGSFSTVGAAVRAVLGAAENEEGAG